MNAPTNTGTRRYRPRRHRTYVLRRIGVAVVLVALIYVGSAGAESLLGGNDDQSLANVSSVPAASSTDTVALTAPTASSTTTTTATTTTTLPPTTIADAGRTPTATDPARVYIAGDSDAGAFAPFLERFINKTGVVTTKLDYKVSSGLARPDFFDWPARFATQMVTLNPDIVIVTFGGNDGQPIHGLNKQVDSPEWRAEYAKRVGAVMDVLSADGRTLIWVGIPNDTDPVTTAHLRIQDEVVRGQVAQHPNVVFIDSWHLFSGLDGGYAEYVVDPRDGLSKRVRSSTDGFHLNSNGAELLAFHIAAAVTNDLKNRGAQL